MAIEAYHLGLPLWGQRAWTGGLYSKDARPADYLEQYARVFNAVEGNSTFYSLPSAATVARWREQTPEKFRFCFKLPRTITHDLRLRDGERETARFLALMEPLGPRLGPFMVQLPASFGPDRLESLARFLAWLPSDFRYAVELRHPDFYRPPLSTSMNELLGRLRIDRVSMDTRPLRSGDAGHPDVIAARHKKPDLPVTAVRTGAHGFVRLICHPDIEVNRPWLDMLAATVASWIDDGARPFVFVHCANNEKAPPIAKVVHDCFTGRANVGRLPAWPGEAREAASGQMSML